MHCAAVSRCERLVGNNENEKSARRCDALKKRPETLAGGTVEVSSGLVGEQDGRFEEQRACNCDALLFATGKCFWSVIGTFSQTKLGQELPSALDERATIAAIEDTGKDDVLKRRERRQQIELLEDHTNRATAVERERRLGHGVDTLARDDDRSAVGAIETGDEMQQRTLAAPRCAHDGDEPAAGNGEIQSTERVDSAITDAVTLLKSAHLDG